MTSPGVRQLFIIATASLFLLACQSFLLARDLRSLYKTLQFGIITLGGLVQGALEYVERPSIQITCSTELGRLFLQYGNKSLQLCDLLVLARQGLSGAIWRGERALQFVDGVGQVALRVSQLLLKAHSFHRAVLQLLRHSEETWMLF
ncbi:protein of unknown function [Aminobacter niigataensis]|nr:protein of unknown function [Aminobacter niigataensis]